MRLVLFVRFQLLSAHWDDSMHYVKHLMSYLYTILWMNNTIIIKKILHETSGALQVASKREIYASRFTYSALWPAE